ncbi:MAG: hypothetical protein KatS3mg001_143 [Candidatus Pacearchaeota archaeon]|nr:MAG: hypothetical protein KatS3mg001_143 [Candidatus Pacearchaeota archaeon]
MRRENYREREIGTYESDLEVNDRIKYFFSRERTKNLELSYLERVALVALSRFPELEEGEYITLKELKNRFKELREAGYPVKAYSKMSRKEALQYLREIREEIKTELEKHNPEFLMEIKKRNRKSIEEAFLLR